MNTPERHLEGELVEKLRDLKYEYRPDIRDRAALEKNFRDRFEALNHVKLTEGEFVRLLDEIVTPDVFAASHTLRHRNSFNVLRFHVDYYKPEGKAIKPGETLAKRAVIDAILAKHD